MTEILSQPVNRAEFFEHPKPSNGEIIGRAALTSFANEPSYDTELYSRTPEAQRDAVRVPFTFGHAALAGIGMGDVLVRRGL